METYNASGEFDRRVLGNIRYHARRLAQRHAVPGMDMDDFVQDLSLDLVRRRAAFDPARAGFRTFADRIVRNRALGLRRATQRAQFERGLMSLAIPVRDVEGEAPDLGEVIPDPAARTEEGIGARVDVGRLLGSLPEPLVACCDILLAGNVLKGARAAGVARSTHYTRLTKLRRIAADRGLAIYVGAKPDSLRASPVCGRQQPDAAMSLRPPNTTLLITTAETRAWLAQAELGAALTYHRGVLAIDRLRGSSRLHELDRGELDRVATLLFQAAGANRVHLVQRRHGRDDYEYVAVKRHPAGGSKS